MNYTNGFDIDVVLPALQKRLGWRQPTVAGSPLLDGDNSTSISGRFFQDFHAMCQVGTIKSSQEDPLITDEQFNTLLVEWQKSAIMRSLNEIFREPELIDDALLYTRFGYNDQPIINGNSFAGYIINIAADNSLSTQIKYATLYFDSDVAFNLYLFQDGVKEPLLTIPVTAQAWQRNIIEFDGNDSPQITLSFVTGRRYYLGYMQSELGTAKAIREQVDEYAKTLCFEAYTISAPATQDGFGFNHNYRQFPFLPAGLNLQITSFRDHTQQIIRKANLFDEVQGLQMAAMVLEQVNNSTRSNFAERQNTQQSQQQFIELNQAFATKEVPVTPGLKSRIMAEFKRLRHTFFPAQIAMSTNMEGGVFDGYENEWAKQNIKQALNPPIV